MFLKVIKDSLLLTSSETLNARVCVLSIAIVRPKREKFLSYISNIEFNSSISSQKRTMSSAY